MSTSLRRGNGGGRVAAATPKGETSGSERVNDSISVAVAESGRKGEIRSLGKIPNDLHAIEKLVARLRKLHGKSAKFHFCYEAGPCGYVLVRRLHQPGHDCIVVAPSKIARKSGDRVKTDRRDAEKLARLHRSGDLDAIYIPEATDSRGERDRSLAEGPEGQTRRRLSTRCVICAGHAPMRWTIAAAHASV